MTRGIRRTRDELISGIKSAWQKGDDLRTGPVQKTDNRWMYRTHEYYFSSWQETLKAAGISYEQVKQAAEGPRKEARKEEYLAELKQAYESGVDLSGSRITAKGNPNRSLHDRAPTYFQGRFFWHDALKAANLPVDKIIRQGLWDKERVKTELKKREQEYKPLSSKKVMEEDGKLYKAIVHHFDSYPQALRYADISVLKNATPERKTDEQILRDIRRYAKRGIPLDWGFIQSNKERAPRLMRTVYNADHRFGNWRNSLTKAGLNTSDQLTRKKWDEESVIRQILLRRKVNLNLDTTSVLEEDSKLYKAGVHYLGSWEAAVKACELDYSQIRETVSLSDIEIITGIQELAENKKKLDVASVSNDKSIDIRRLFHQAEKKFKNGWAGAIVIAGLNYDQVRQRRKPYTIQELTAEIKALKSRGKSLEAVNITSNPETARFHNAIYRRGFKSWYDFLDSAGIDTSDLRKGIDWDEGKGVLRELKKRAKNGVIHSPTSDRNLAAAIRTYFGTVESAVKSAGLGYVFRGRIIVPPPAGIINPEISIGISKEKLAESARKGDQNAFNILLELYRPEIENLVNKITTGSREENRMIIYTTFLEIINKEKAISGDFTEKLEKRVKKRIREEQPSWISLDRELGEGDGNTLLDYVDESGELTQEKGDYARAGDF